MKAVYQKCWVCDPLSSTTLSSLQCKCRTFILNTTINSPQSGLHGAYCNILHSSWCIGATLSSTFFSRSYWLFTILHQKCLYFLEICILGSVEHKGIHVQVYKFILCTRNTSLKGCGHIEVTGSNRKRQHDFWTNRNVHTKKVQCKWGITKLSLLSMRSGIQILGILIFKQVL